MTPARFPADGRRFAIFEPEDICQGCNERQARIADLEAENARLLRALHREVDHHIDIRTPNTDRPTRERLTNGAPAARSGE